MIALGSAAILIGLTLRWFFREHATLDAFNYLLPWYHFARDHGIAALHDQFTNYTPFYSYLLLVAAQFDNLAAPLTLIKSISLCFELGCATVVAEIVWQSTKAPLRAAVAFVGVWLAPTVVLNGAVWGQADSIWAFFVLLSVSLWMRDRNGMLPFAAGVAVKAQAVFLGPFVVGMMLRRKLPWAWFFALPTVYLVFALPVLAAGRPLASVLKVYLAQAGTFHSLTMDAANIWVFAGQVPYAIGVPVGIALAGLAGAALTLFIARVRRDGPEFIMLSACASLLVMPLLLPKMHDRYFYAFELASIALACIDTRYLAYPILAQVNGVLAYLAFDPGISIGVPPAALCNILLGFHLLTDICVGDRPSRLPVAAWMGFVAASVALLAYAFAHPSASASSFDTKLLTAAFVGGAFWLLSASRRVPPVSPDVSRGARAFLTARENTPTNPAPRWASPAG